MRDSFYLHSGKRVFDLIAVSICLIPFFPLLLVLALLIKLTDPGPVLYKHRRIGKDFKPFYLYKFRSMRIGSDRNGLPITRKGDPRITPIGRILRRTKLDELPQLFNVLKGEISLVGPRPEVENYVNLFRSDYEKILKVRPGITDFAAIEYRDEEKILAGFEDTHFAYSTVVLPAKVKLYQQYLARISFKTDLFILLMTFRRLFQ